MLHCDRGRIARELHDEVGRSLTAILLDLKRLADTLPGDRREDLHAVQESVRTSLDEIRRIARRLRPAVLEEVGLVSALKALSAEFFADHRPVWTDLGRNLPARNARSGGHDRPHSDACRGIVTQSSSVQRGHSRRCADVR